MHDVYAYGVIAPSTLYELSDRFPSTGGYAEIAHVHPSIGGEAAGGAYVLARLGIPTKLNGNRLHDDEMSAHTIDVLSSAGVDCTAITLDSQAVPLMEAVFAAGESRTVFGAYGRLLAQRSWNEPARADVAASRIVCVDPFFEDASLRVARWCREANTPYVTIDVHHESEMAHHAAALIISEEFASRTFAPFDPGEVLAAYTARCRGLVVLTRGGRRLLYARAGAPIQEHVPFSVEVRDTTGAGDSFRAGVIYGMLRGYDDQRTITTASAVAALVCRQAPSFLNSPTRSELEEFLSSGPDYEGSNSAKR